VCLPGGEWDCDGAIALGGWVWVLLGLGLPEGSGEV
jgi:hypothetical protein